MVTIHHHYQNSSRSKIMPIYEYECTHCADKIEILQSINAEPLKQCPKCGQDTLRKVIAPTSFVLKGSGWYVTDYPSADRKKAMESEQKQSSKGTETKASESKKSTEKKEAPKKSEPAVSKAS